MNAARCSLGSMMLLSLTIAACGGTPSTENRDGTNPTKSAEAIPPKAAPRDVELRPGTIIAVRLERALSTVRNRAGDTFAATLDEPIVVDDVEILPRGTRISGHVTTSKASGRLEGRAVLGITLDAFDRNGHTYPITTSLDTKTSEAHKKRNITAVGGGAGIGALIGGLAGGGKGAAIGAAVGASAGTGAAAATGKKDIEVPAETLFRFSLKSAVIVPD
jgi:hypothetical protein